MNQPTQYQSIGSTPLSSTISSFGPQTKTEAEVKQYAELGGYAIGSIFYGPAGGQVGAELADLLISILGAVGIFGGGPPSPPARNPYIDIHARAIGEIPVSPEFLKHHPKYLYRHPHARVG